MDKLYFFSCFAWSSITLSALSTLPVVCISFGTLHSLCLTFLSLSFMFQYNYAGSTETTRRLCLGQEALCSNRRRVSDDGSVCQRLQGLCPSEMPTHAGCCSCWSLVSNSRRIQVRDGNQRRAHGRFAGKCHIQRQEVDGVSEGPHSCRGPIEPLAGGAQVPRSQVHVAEVGTGELPKCSERPSSKKAGKQVYRRAR